MTQLYGNTDEYDIWQQVDSAFWRGELLDFGEEILSSKLTGTERDVAILILKAEACELDGSNPKHAQMVERLGQSGPAAHSARVALAYAHHSFFVGDWQTCLDALRQAAVTALRSEEAKSRELRRLRAEAYLRLADYWAFFRQQGLVLHYLFLAFHAFPDSSTRLYCRLRHLFASSTSFSAALLNLIGKGYWATVYQRLVDRVFDDLPHMGWPQHPDLEHVELADGLRAAFEVCLSEYLIGSEDARLPWANKAIFYAEKMKSPAWIAVADILVASSARNSEDLNLVERHLSRALKLIRRYRLEGLLVYAMSANLPLIQVQFGLDAAANQAREALKQVLGQVALIRDLVIRRRILWCFEDAFIKAFTYALKAKNTENALEAILLSKGLGWQSSDVVVAGDKEMAEAREKETGLPLIGETLFEPNSMRTGVFGPQTNPLPGMYGEVGTMVNLGDTVARSELLQLVRERIFGFGSRVPIAVPPLPGNALEIFFVIDHNTIQRIERWGQQTRFVTLGINYNSIKENIKTSGLSVTTANRPGPVDYIPIDRTIERLFVGLPDAAKQVDRIIVWPHGLLHSIPFTYALRTLLPQAPLVSIMLGVEECRFASPIGESPAIRLAPAYSMPHCLTYASREVDSAKGITDTVRTGSFISAMEILELLRKSPSVFHFAGHAVNRNDHPELAGLYASDLSLVSIADILNVGCGPRTTVLSSCETGLGPLLTADGSYTLPRAFLQIGSEWVVASLWKIEDEATYTIMKSFFANLRKGLEPEQALPLTRHPFVVYRSRRLLG